MSASSGDVEEERLIAGILLQARVEDPQAVIRLLMTSQIKASDLISVSDERAEAMLQKAGLLIGDCIKIVRVLRGFHAGQMQSPRTSAANGVTAFANSLCCCCSAAFRCMCSASKSAASGPVKPSIKCMLIVYSTTVLIVTITVLSFYLPAMLFQVRSNHRRIAGHDLLPAQANFLMPTTGGGRFGGAGGGRQYVSAAARVARGGEVMMVTANQPLPCTTRRGDWIMELALRNKLMYATLHDYKTWWSTELVSAWDLEAAWNKIPLLYTQLPNALPCHGRHSAARLLACFASSPPQA